MAGNLQNRTIVITRGQEQSAGLAAAVRNFGGNVVMFPTIKITGVEDRTACLSAVESIKRYDWIVFTSANAVRFFPEFTQLDILHELHCKIAVVGEQTAQELKDRRISIHLKPESFRGSALVSAFETIGLKGKRVLFPASTLARDEVPDGLRALGASVARVDVYQTSPNWDLDGAAMGRMIYSKQVDCLTFCSPSAIRFFIEIVGATIVRTINDRGIVVAAIGPTTSRAVESAGISKIIVPRQSIEKELVAAIVEHFGSLQ